MQDIEKLVDVKTRALVVQSPSDPTGAVYSRQHMLDILSCTCLGDDIVTQRHSLVIVSEYLFPFILNFIVYSFLSETYSGMVFSGNNNTSFAQLSMQTPVLAISGIGNRFLVPGWRLGWILIHDRGRDVSEASASLCLDPNRIK